MVAPAAPSARLRLQAPVPTPVALRQQALARAAVVQPRASVAPPGGQRAVEADEDAEEADLEEFTYELSAEKLAPEVEAAFRRGPGTLPAVTAIKGEDLKNMATCQGACALLPLYREGVAPLRFSLDPVWSQAMRAAGIAARQELPKQPRAATWQQVVKAVSEETSSTTQVAMLLAWFTAARCGCVLQLHASDVEITATGLMVRFRRGKSVRVRGPYTVHTRWPSAEPTRSSSSARSGGGPSRRWRARPG